MTNKLRIAVSVLLVIFYLTVMAEPVLGFTYENWSDRQDDAFMVYMVLGLSILVLAFLVYAIVKKQRKPKDMNVEIPDSYKNKLSAGEKIIAKTQLKNKYFVAADKRLLKFTPDGTEALAYEQITKVKKVFRVNPTFSES
jgi:hypothetical protein